MVSGAALAPAVLATAASKHLARGGWRRPLPVPTSAFWNLPSLGCRPISSSSVFSSHKNNEDEGRSTQRYEKNSTGLSWAPRTVAQAELGVSPQWPSSEMSTSKPSGRVVRVSEKEISYSVVIEKMSSQGSMQTAETLLQEMLDSEVKPNIFVFNAVIAGFARRGQTKEASVWLGKLQAAGLTPNVMSYTALIDSCAKAGDSDGAVKWFNLLVEKDLSPNAVSYNAVINSFARVGDTDNALEWLARMRAVVPPDKVSYNSAIHSCAMADPPRAEEAEELFREMKSAGLDATASTLNALERAVGSSRRDQLCLDLGIDIDKALQRKHAREHRQARPLQR
eukprot:TRINITY_DN28648_c0_g1_i1.p1 TRINITY_DN28648_c0_g1~~TRINITY_DN28648_c0_g1_i1.p1  ORF type:complete len:338 (-),score=56.45 TRINITY_DN28648_c0_g1_i1:64-1077(-)